MTRAGASFKPEKKVEDPVTRQLRRALEAQEKTKRDARFARLKELKDANRKQRSRT
jgi:hypothetical protein